jgi:hypothetical protein
MFKDVTEKKQTHLISDYYHSDFQLFANGLNQNYKEYLLGHEGIHKTAIEYKVNYDEKTFVESDNKFAGRVFIDVSLGDISEKIEVILIIEFKDGKIYRLWETAYPDWSKMEMFKNYGK